MQLLHAEWPTDLWSGLLEMTQVNWDEEVNSGSPNRRQLLAIALVGASDLSFAGSGNTQRTVNKERRVFMEGAIQDLDRQRAEMLAELEKAKAEGRGAPLYVRLPNVVPFLDWDFYYVDGDLQWAPTSDPTLPNVNVPKGFVTDLASVPPILWSKYPPTGRYAYAAIVHDYLYWTQTTTRAVADEVMVAAMQDAGTDDATIKNFKRALGLFGKRAWNENQRKRAAGERRLLSKFPDNRLVTWATWKATPEVFHKGAY